MSVVVPPAARVLATAETSALSNTGQENMAWQPRGWFTMVVWS